MSQSRVVLANLYPTIECGKYPIKRIKGEKVKVKVDAITDGHEYVRVELKYKCNSDRQWKTLEMAPLENDRYEVDFLIEKEENYSYTVHAWLDHALNWLYGTRKKVLAGQNVSSELSEASIFFNQIPKKGKKAFKESLEKWEKLFSIKANYEAAIEVLKADQIEKLFIQYPSKLNASSYEKSFEVEVERTAALNSAWYEFFPRSASSKNEHGTFKDCIQLLPRIQKLGFDVIYLPPIHPIGEVNRKGKNNTTEAKEGDVGSCWGIGSKVGGHKAVHPDLGTLEDYKKLIQAANKRGMEIALDFALQCAPDHPWVKKHPEWFKWRPDGTIQYAENPPKKYQDILPLHFETEDWKNLWDACTDVALYWCKQGVKYFRVDNPHTKPFNFWKYLIEKVKKAYPGTLFLAEAFTKPKVMHTLTKIGFSQSVTYFTWRNFKHELIGYMSELTAGFGAEYFRPNFWVNTPDINPYNLQEPNESMYKIRFFLAATMSPSYGIYGPVFEYMDCAPVEGKEEYLNSEKYEVRHWNWDIENELTQLIEQVNKIRHKEKALQQLRNYTNCHIDNDAIIAYYKASNDGASKLLMVVSLDPYNDQIGWVQSPMDEIGKQPEEEYEVQDLLTGEIYRWRGEFNYIALKPEHPFHLLKFL